jgi:hypothetical protein
MAEKPVLFSAAMVQAILAGKKTMTRRVVSPQPPTECAIRTFVEESTDPRTDRSFAWYDRLPLPTRSHYVRCPFGHPGDKLWVRESWRVSQQWDNTKPSELPHERGMTVFFDAGGSRAHDASHQYVNDDNYLRPGEARPSWVGKGRPSIFLPRWASRISLEVTGVRVERLQDISKADAIAEGAQSLLASGARWPDSAAKWSLEYPHPVELDAEHGDQHCLGSPQMAFANKWNSINAQREGCLWANSPWVWCVSFRRVDQA